MTGPAPRSGSQQARRRISGYKAMLKRKDFQHHLLECFMCAEAESVGDPHGRCAQGKAVNTAIAQLDAAGSTPEPQPEPEPDGTLF